MIVRKISEPKFSSFMCPNSFPFDIQLTGGYQCKILQIYIRKPIKNLPQCNICNNFIFLFLIEKKLLYQNYKDKYFSFIVHLFFLFFLVWHQKLPIFYFNKHEHYIYRQIIWHSIYTLQVKVLQSSLHNLYVVKYIYESKIICNVVFSYIFEMNSIVYASPFNDFSRASL